jgi:hypothetical protein
MSTPLIKGEGKSSDGLELITQMIHLKIEFHENKMDKSEKKEIWMQEKPKWKRSRKICSS